MCLVRSVYRPIDLLKITRYVLDTNYIASTILDFPLPVTSGISPANFIGIAVVKNISSQLAIEEMG